MLNAPSEREPAARLLRLVEELAAEIHAHPSGRRAFTLDSALDRDVGLDSLARVELFARMEREFGVAFSERLFSEVGTIHDLLSALSDKRPASEPTADPRAPVEPPSLRARHAARRPNAYRGARMACGQSSRSQAHHAPRANRG